MKRIYVFVLLLLVLSSCSGGCDDVYGPSAATMSECTVACGIRGVRTITYTKCVCFPPPGYSDAGVPK